MFTFVFHGYYQEMIFRIYNNLSFGKCVWNQKHMGVRKHTNNIYVKQYVGVYLFIYNGWYNFYVKHAHMHAQLNCKHYDMHMKFLRIPVAMHKCIKTAICDIKLSGVINLRILNKNCKSILMQF